MDAPPKRRRRQFSLATLLLLMTLVAIGTRPALRVYRHWEETRRSPQPEISVRRAIRWLQENQETNDSWNISPSAGQSQESDLPGSP